MITEPAIVGSYISNLQRQEVDTCLEINNPDTFSCESGSFF